MSSKQYHNVFSYHTAKTKVTERNLVLENNVTKSFINVIESIRDFSTCPNKNGCIKRIVDSICSPITVCPKASLFEMHFEVEDIDGNNDISNALKNILKPENCENNKYLVLIVPEYRREDANEQISRGFMIAAGNTRIDALIGVGNGFAIAIESKINSRIMRSQLKGHLSKMGIKNSHKKHIIVKTWKDVCQGIEFYTSGCERDERILCDFISKQFCDFLDSYSLRGFMGFKSEYFSFDKSEPKHISDELRFTAGSLTDELGLDNAKILKNYFSPKAIKFTRKCKRRENPFIEYRVKRDKLHASQIIGLCRENDPFMEVYFHIDHPGLKHLRMRLKSNREFKNILKNLIGYQIQIYHYDKIKDSWPSKEWQIDDLVKQPKLLSRIIEELDKGINLSKNEKWEFAITKEFKVEDTLKPETKQEISKSMEKLDKFREYLIK